MTPDGVPGGRSGPSRRIAPRLWRYAVPALVAVAASVVAETAGDLAGTSQEVVVAVVAAVVLLAAMVALVRTSAAGLATAVERRSGEAAGALASTAALAVGSALTVLVVLAALGVSLGSLLVGGALTGVVVGIALQQVLGNVVAGVVLLLTRPYGVGDLVRLRGGTTGGVLEGRVLGATLTHQLLRTREGVLRLPNAGVLGAVIGPSVTGGALPPVDDPGSRQDAGPPEGSGGGAARGWRPPL
ncbi:mechanosensitive ion channel family protein [Pseudokineococcus basanitobsidens]|uniref:Mechanosensitive ion channel family protein n=1 Tax=Pseudokineococcus basanitobsidens TaxID=1926649 RepID=A0ABU8RH65_9ACTN